MDSPFETFEIRWFSREPLPVNRELICPDPLQSRTDNYLVPMNRSCGVKFRENLLETKIRTGSERSLSTDSVSGTAAPWSKWSGSWGARETPSGELWIPVEKTRWLHGFGRTEGGAIVPFGASTEPRAEFEFGLVSVGGDDWETVCIECSGGGEEELATLMTDTIRHLEETGWIVGSLTAELSQSYPEWLATTTPPGVA